MNQEIQELLAIPNTAELAYPFQSLLNEERFHLFSNIKAKLFGADNAQISFEPLSGNILVTNLRLCWFNFSKKFEDLSAQDKQLVEAISLKHGQKKDSWQCLNLCGKSFMFYYSRLLSHGLQGSKLRCFLGDKDGEEEISQGEEQHRGFEDVLKQMTPEEIVEIEYGKYEIEFDLQLLEKQVQEELFDILTDYSLTQESEHTPEFSE